MPIFRFASQPCHISPPADMFSLMLHIFYAGLYTLADALMPRDAIDAFH
jgi:hypothetical protein